jgi:hypothetical protein
MSLNIVSVLPDVSSTGVILQGAIIITFDQEIDPTTLTESSFLLSAPTEGSRPAPDGLVGVVSPVSGTDYVDGAFSFALNSTGATIATFKPSRPMRPNVRYTVLISTDVATVAGVALSGPYTWTFTTGVLNLTIPPLQNPLPSQVGRIRLEDLTVTPSSTLNNDLHLIVITFPSNIDATSFDPKTIDVDLEAFLQDLDITVPTVTSQTVTVAGNTLTIALTF